MDGIEVGFSFVRKSANPIDATLVLTKAQMVSIDDNLMPEVYFAACKDDKKLYIYDNSATPSTETGKFKKLEGGGGGGTDSYLDLDDLPQINGVELINNKTGGDLHLQDKMDNITNQEIDNIIFA